jgi:hypothetical protein
VGLEAYESKTQSCIENLNFKFPEPISTSQFGTVLGFSVSLWYAAVSHGLRKASCKPVCIGRQHRVSH